MFRVLPLLALVACTAAPSAIPDAGSEPDASVDAGPAPFDACTGSCRTVSLEASFGGKTRAFERAQFGLTSPENGKSGGWELYLEAHAGGDAACPSDQSPTPKMTLVLSGIALPEGDSVRTEADGLHATFFDFSGELTDAPLLKATHVQLTPRALRACLPGADAGAGSCDDPVFAFDLDATFDGGEIHGHAFALHCDTYDDL